MVTIKSSWILNWCKLVPLNNHFKWIMGNNWETFASFVKQWGITLFGKQLCMT